MNESNEKENSTKQIYQTKEDTQEITILLVKNQVPSQSDSNNKENNRQW